MRSYQNLATINTKVDDRMQRYKVTKLVSYLGIIFNLFLFLIKLFVSTLTSSQAMMADAINSLGDILSSLMTWIGNKVASKPKDKDHNLGHGKAEYIYSLLISIVIILMALTLMKDSFFAIWSPSQYTFSYLLIVVCLITIFVKLTLYFYIHKVAKTLNSLLLKANSKDHLYDALITTLNLFATLLTHQGIYFIDGIAGVLIALWILIHGLKIFKESYDVLMDKTMDQTTKKQVLKIIKQFQEVKKVRNFIAIPVGYQYQVSFTIYVDGEMTTYASHQIATDIEKELKKFPELYLVVIHVEPI